MGGQVDPGILAAKNALKGNCLPIKLIPTATQICCVGSAPERGAMFCRIAGTYATVIGKEESSGGNKYMAIRLQSGEICKVDGNAPATLGVLSSTRHHITTLGKARRPRWLNIRPTVRGMAMNAVDHPHGVGSAESKGNRTPTSPWGTPISLFNTFHSAS